MASSTTIGPAGGRGGRNAGPPALAGLFAGGVPRPKAMASHGLLMLHQFTYKALIMTVTINECVARANLG